jgi:hypothetical protein
MSEMIRRVARAICQVDGFDPDQKIRDFEGHPRTGGGIMLPIYRNRWQDYLNQAKAAMTACEEPTDEMVQAAMNGASAPLCDGEIRSVWGAMARAAAIEL